VIHEWIAHQLSSNGNFRQNRQEHALDICFVNTNVVILENLFSCLFCRTIDEAIKKANNTKYGLAAGIVTKNLDVANTVSRSIRAGTIWINCYFAFDNDCSYGGYKMSGFGRHLGMEALHKFLQVKSVVTPIYNSPWLWIRWTGGSGQASSEELLMCRVFLLFLNE